MNKLVAIVLSLSAACAINYIGRSYEFKSSYFDRFHVNDVIQNIYDNYRNINKDQDYKSKYEVN